MYNKNYNDDSIRNPGMFFVDFVKPYLSKEFHLIDLGCGSCRKVVELAPYVAYIAAADRNKIMLKYAKKRISRSGIRNIGLYECDNFNTPFASHQFDVCTSSLSTWSVPEVHRLLKSGGHLFIETLAPDDKSEIKLAFGKDELGDRGYLLNQTTEERIKRFTMALEPLFEIQTVLPTESKTSITKAGFVKLLETTPTIRNFSAKRDKKIIDSIAEDGKVSFMERRIIISAVAREV